MQMNLVKLITVAEWTSRNVDDVLGIVNQEDNAVAGIGQNAAHSMFVQMQYL